MYLNSFSLRINEGREKESGYVELEHGKHYTLNLRNDRPVRCDAQVSIDGKDVGTFRISPNSSIRLERPSNDDRKFTFYKLDSEEGEKSELNRIGKQELGLVQVTFKPEIQVNSQIPTTWIYTSTWTPNYHRPSWGSAASLNDLSTNSNTDTLDYTSCEYSCSSRGLIGENSETISRSAGGTGLSGQSNQSFYNVSHLNYDEQFTTVISVRLVASERRDPRPLQPVVTSNPVPPPVN